MRSEHNYSDNGEKLSRESERKATHKIKRKQDKKKSRELMLLEHHAQAPPPPPPLPSELPTIAICTGCDSEWAGFCSPWRF